MIQFALMKQIFCGAMINFSAKSCENGPYDVTGDLEAAGESTRELQRYQCYHTRESTIIALSSIRSSWTRSRTRCVSVECMDYLGSQKAGHWPGGNTCGMQERLIPARGEKANCKRPLCRSPGRRRSEA